MKKAVLIVFAVAILGALGLYAQKKPSATTSGLVSPPSTSNSQPQNTSASSSSGSSPSSSATLKDGTYAGSNADTPYGTVQIAVVVSGGKISDINFLQMPSDQGHSREVTAYAEPLLKQETIGKTNANIDFVSGATSTSTGYEQSLQAALNQAA